MKIKTLTTWEEAAVLQDRWNELLSEFEQPTPFLTYEWMKLWWQYFGAGKQLCLLIAENEAGVQAIAPLMSYNSHSFLGLPLRVIQLIGNYDSNRLDLLTSRSWRREAIMAISQHLAAQEWQMLDYFLIPEESPNLQPLLDCSQHLGFKTIIQASSKSPYLTIASDWEKYLKSQTYKFRSSLNNKFKLLSQQGGVRFEAFGKKSDPEILMSMILNIASHSWSAKTGTAISSTPELRGFYSDLARVALQKNWLDCYVLFAGDTPIAFEFNLRFNEKIFNLKRSYLANFSEYSPGTVLMSQAIKEAFLQEVKEYDFLGESEPFKMQWTQATRQHLKVFIFNDHFYSYWLHWLPLYAKEKIKKNRTVGRLIRRDS